MDNWQEFKDSRFALLFKVPEVTPQGHIVDNTEGEQGESIRAHFTSRDSKELYFEVIKYEHLTTQAEHLQHQTNLEQRFSKFSTTELKEIG